MPPDTARSGFIDPPCRGSDLEMASHVTVSSGAAAVHTALHRSIYADKAIGYYTWQTALLIREGVIQGWFFLVPPDPADRTK